MGNPTITRLGRTQIWYKKWYNDSSYKSTLKITYTFENLLNHYFNYGLHSHKNFFYNNYWYKNNLLKQKHSDLRVKNLDLYFRKYYYAHTTLTIEHSYFLRLKTPEFFPLRVYILRYSNWILASIQWFKPLKTTNKLNSVHKNTSTTLITTKNKTLNTYTLKNRLKLVLMLTLYLSKNSNKSTDYNF